MRNREERSDCDGNEKGQMTDVSHSSRTRRGGGGGWGSLTPLDLALNPAVSQSTETGCRIRTRSKVKRLSLCVSFARDDVRKKGVGINIAKQICFIFVFARPIKASLKARQIPLSIQLCPNT